MTDKKYDPYKDLASRAAPTAPCLRCGHSPIGHAIRRGAARVFRAMGGLYACQNCPCPSYDDGS